MSVLDRAREAGRTLKGRVEEPKLASGRGRLPGPRRESIRGGESTDPLSTDRDIAAEYRWLHRIHPERRVLRGRAYLAVKRLMDLAIITLALPVLLPLLGLGALLVKLESPRDPAFFRQLRTGQDGRRFWMYKYRTMVVNAQQLKQELAHLNEVPWPDFYITNDPRITRVGRVLRRTSLDELPQMLNILKGDMSLVGPRPTSWGPETYAPWQLQRLRAKPGITGLAQLLGRKLNQFDDRVRLDLVYIERRCVRLDVEILLRTIPAVIRARGAH
jgi:lipopolysaccharide/colanic/teichoic acid biosynthesis glycosyltransferase